MLVSIHVRFWIVVSACLLAAVAATDPMLIHLKAFDLPPQEKRLVIRADGIVALGELIAAGYLRQD